MKNKGKIKWLTVLLFTCICIQSLFCFGKKEKTETSETVSSSNSTSSYDELRAEEEAQEKARKEAADKALAESIEEARYKAEQEARKLAEQEARERAEQEARQRAEEERFQLELQTRQKAEEERHEAEMLSIQREVSSHYSTRQSYDVTQYRAELEARQRAEEERHIAAMNSIRQSAESQHIAAMNTINQDAQSRYMDEVNDIVNSSTPSSDEESSDSLIDSYDSQINKLETQIKQYEQHLENQGAYMSTNERNQEIKKIQAAEKQIEELKQKQSECIGDPVHLTNGQYADMQTDLSIRYLRNSFDLTRTYTTDTEIDGSFGKNWLSSLDSRLIFGLYPVNKAANEKVYDDTILKTVQELNALYDLKDSLSVQSDSETLNQTIQNEMDMKHYEEAENLIDAYKSSLFEQTEYYNELEEKNQINMYITEKNSSALFPGTPDYYRYTGIETITLIDTSGHTHLFKNSDLSAVMNAVDAADGTMWYASQDADYSSITKTSDGYIVTRLNGFILHYSPEGLLIRETDAYGNWISFNRENQKIADIETSTGCGYTVTYAGQYISSVVSDADPGNCVHFSYTENRISSITDSYGDTVFYTWDKGLLSGMIKPDGSSIRFSFELTDSNGKLLTTSTTNEEKYSEFFDYNLSGKETLHTDHSGKKTLYNYNDDYKTTGIQYSDGSFVKYSYDDSGNVIHENRNGNITSFEYDSFNRKTRVIYSDGSTEKWLYDSRGFLTSHTDRDGITLEYIRNSAGDITEFIIGGITRLRRTYTNQGLVDTETEYREFPVVTRFEYDLHGNMIKAVTDGKTEEWTWTDGDFLSSYKINGIVVEEYSEKGRTKVEESRSGLITEYTENNRKDLVSVIQTDTVTGEKRITEYEYDKRHLVTAEWKGDGSSRKLTGRYRYDGEGRKEAAISYRDDEAVILFYSYTDSNGLVLPSPASITVFNVSSDDVKLYNLHDSGAFSTVDFSELINKAEECYCSTYKTEYLSSGQKQVTYTDPRGYNSIALFDYWDNLLSKTDTYGILELNTYTKNGRPSSKTGEYGGKTYFSYDSSGNTSSVRDDSGNSRTITYYPDNTIASVITVEKSKDASSPDTEETVICHYTSDGNLSSIENKDGTIWYFYDCFGQLSVLLCGGSGKISDAVTYTTLDYSDDMRSLTVTEGGCYVTYYSLNAWGEPVSVTDGNGNTSGYGYDCCGNLTCYTDGYGNKTNYVYNQADQLTCIQYSDGNSQFFEYNVLGKISRISDSDGTSVLQEFDGAGNLIRKAGRGLVDTRMDYDERNRLTCILENDIPILQNAYLENGTLTTSTDAKNHTSYSNYDSYGNLVSETDRNGFTRYPENDSSNNNSEIVRDINGNITELTDEETHIVFVYDQGGRLVAQRNLSTGNDFYYSYDKAGNRIQMTDGNRTVNYEYGCNNELIFCSETQDGILVSSVTIDYDCMGKEICRTFLNGVYQTTSYDNLGNVILSAQYDASDRLIFGEGYLYDDNGRIKASVTSEGIVTLCEYDASGRLVSYSQTESQDLRNSLAKEAETYGYISDSQESVSCVETEFLSPDVYSVLQNYLNQMRNSLGNSLTVMQPFLKTEYMYDENGNRVSKTTGFGTISYSYDAENRMLSAGSHSYAYDDSGNMLSDSSPFSIEEYEYSSDNRIIKASISDSLRNLEIIKAYTYDPLGRRIYEDSFNINTNGVNNYSERNVSEYAGFSFNAEMIINHSF